MDLRTMACCGVREISALSAYSTAETALLAFKENIFNYGSRFRYVIFTQARTSNSYGERFAALLKENHLGEVMETPFNANPNTGNQVKVWIWTVDHVALGNWKAVTPVAPVIEEKKAEVPPGAVPFYADLSAAAARSAPQRRMAAAAVVARTRAVKVPIPE